MKKFTILFMLTCIFYGDYSQAHPYKIKEYEDKGPVRLAFKYTSRFTKEEVKYELGSLKEEDIEKLLSIRSMPEVYSHYDNHAKPDEEVVRNTLLTKLLPRVTEQSNSLFPFILRKVIKTKMGETFTKSYEVLGFFNIGTGFDANGQDRQFGYYLNPGRKLTDEEIKHQRREEGKVHYENWGEGTGSAALKVGTHFIMQFHEQASGTLTIQPKKKEAPRVMPIGRTRFTGKLTSTVDNDNERSSKALENVGLRKLSPEEINILGYTENVKGKIYSEEKKGFNDTIKDYYEMTWDEFVKNEKNGLYNLK